MLRRQMLPYYTLIPFLLLVGCSTGKEAKQVTRVTLGQLNTYEQLVDKKIAGENKYYKDSVTSLQESLGRSAFSAEASLISEASMDFQAKVMASPTEIQARDLKDFIKNILKETRGLRERYSGATREYGPDLLASLEKLDLQQDSLLTVRKDLEKLQSDSSSRDMLKEWFEFGMTTKEKFDELEKKDSK